MSVELLIEKSTGCYQAMLDHLAAMSELLNGASPEAIQRMFAEWDLLQQQARRVDTQLDPQLDANRQTDLVAKLRQRTDLMEQVAIRCQQVCSQANLLKTLASDELNSLQQGREALGGYRGRTDRKGSRLSASF